MNLRSNLHDVLLVRAAADAGAARCLVAGSHGRATASAPPSSLVAVAVLLIANRSLLVRAHRGDTRRRLLAMVVVDLALVHGRRLLRRRCSERDGHLLRLAHRLSRLFCSALWVSYAVVAAAERSVCRRLAAAANGRLTNATHGRRRERPPRSGHGDRRQWRRRLSAHRPAHRAPGPRRSCASRAQLEQAKAAARRSSRSMRAANEQLRAMSESSRVFLRHQDLDGLMPDALAQVTAGSAAAAVSPSSTTTTAAEDDERGAVGDVPRGVRRAPQGARRRRRRPDGASRPRHGHRPAVGPPAQGRRESRLPRLLVAPLGPRTSCSAWSACSTGATSPPTGARCTSWARSAASWPWSSRTSSTTRSCAHERGAHPPRPAQERLHGHHEPRAAHAADLDHRL